MKAFDLARRDAQGRHQFRANRRIRRLDVGGRYHQRIQRDAFDLFAECVQGGVTLVTHPRQNAFDHLRGRRARAPLLVQPCLQRGRDHQVIETAAAQHGLPRFGQREDAQRRRRKAWVMERHIIFSSNPARVLAP